jgi:hypothetical protein
MAGLQTQPMEKQVKIIHDLDSLAAGGGAAGGWELSMGGRALYQA